MIESPLPTSGRAGTHRCPRGDEEGTARLGTGRRPTGLKEAAPRVPDFVSRPPSSPWTQRRLHIPPDSYRRQPWPAGVGRPPAGRRLHCEAMGNGGVGIVVCWASEVHLTGFGMSTLETNGLEGLGEINWQIVLGKGVSARKKKELGYFSDHFEPLASLECLATGCSTQQNKFPKPSQPQKSQNRCYQGRQREHQIST